MQWYRMGPFLRSPCFVSFVWSQVWMGFLGYAPGNWWGSLQLGERGSLQRARSGELQSEGHPFGHPFLCVRRAGKRHCA